MMKSYRLLNEKIPLVLLMALSTVLHIIFLIQFQKTPYAALLMVDAEVYHLKALKLFNEGWLGNSAFYQAPFYSYFLAVLYKIFGPGFFPIQCIQIVLSILNVGLIYSLTHKIFDQKTGIVAATLAVFTGIYMFFSVLMLKVTLSLFFTCSMLWVLVQDPRSPKYGKWLLGGMLLGINVTLRGNFLLMVPGFIFWILVFIRNLSFKVKLRRALIFFLGTLIILFPVTLRNYFVSKDFVLTTYQAGANFYIGNNPVATGSVTKLDFSRDNPEFEENDFRRKAESLAGRPLKPSEISRFWFGQSFKFIREDPAHFLSLLVRKMFLSLNHYEIPDNYDFYFMRSMVPVLKAEFVSYGFLTLCALLGITLGRPKSEGAWLLYIFLGLYTASMVLFFVTSRYRIPMTPVLTSFAAWFLVHGFKNIRCLGKLALTGFVGAGILLGTIIFFPTSYSNFEFSRFQLGVAFERKLMEPEAEKEYLAALNINPRYGRAHMHLGLLYRKNQQSEKALLHFEKAVSKNPGLTEAWFQIGTLSMIKGELEYARDAYKKALAIKPNVAEAHMNLGMIYHNLGNLDRAIWEHQAALKIKPVYPEVYFNLGGFFALKKKFHWSQYCYRKAKEQGYPVSDKIFEQFKRILG